eukprot:29817-Eustigmatos_ZCMA.PRE.1
MKLRSQGWDDRCSNDRTHNTTPLYMLHVLFIQCSILLQHADTTYLGMRRHISRPQVRRDLHTPRKAPDWELESAPKFQQRGIIDTDTVCTERPIVNR